MMRKRFFGLAAVVAAGAAGIFGLVAAMPTQAAQAQALPSFGSCSELLRYAKRNALPLVGPYGLGGTFLSVSTSADGAPAPAEGAVATEDSAQSNPSFSDTNVQEAGVDEPDLAKSNGKTLFAIAQGKLQAVDVSSGKPTLLSTLSFGDTWPQQLLLHGNRLLVIASSGFAFEPLIDPAPGTEIYPSGIPTTVLTEVDVSDPASMQILKTMTVEASYISARMVGSTVRLAATSSPIFAFVYPTSDRAKDIAAAKKRNRAIVRGSRASNWLPSYHLKDAAGRTIKKSLLTCPQVRHPEDFSGVGTLSVLTIDLARGIEPIDSDAILAGGQTVYASPTGLYVATQQWIDPASTGAPDQAPPSITTAIHKFDISSPTSTEYRGSGEIGGYLLNQFSLSEKDGYLRVAATDQPLWWGTDQTESESSVAVLTERSGQLVEVGRVGGLGKGERIYAVRFLGDLGYVVTFRQIDPLYVVDLSDPTAPVVRGELKIPGFSSYLHPIGAGTLLGIGQDADSEGRTLGTQLSVFDVSDSANPSRLQHLTFGQSWSSAEYDHHAFLYWPATQTAVLPVDTYTVDATGNATYQSVAVVLHASPTGIAQLGTIDHGRISYPGDPSGFTYPVAIYRSFVVGDVLYTVSESGVKANSLSTLAELGWAAFPALNQDGGVTSPPIPEG
jgi:hypothetical protein